MDPAEATCYFRFKRNILRRIPLVKQGILHQRLTEPKSQVTELLDFVFGVGIVEAYNISVTGRQKNNPKNDWDQKKRFATHGRLFKLYGPVIK